MKRTWLMLGVGAGMMYLFDPDRGKRRRALARDKIVHTTHQASEGLSVASRDAANRVQGFAAYVQSFLGSEPMTDERLAHRVRARIGRLVSHPGAIAIAVRDANVTLTGPVLRHEVPRLLRGVHRVRGVRGVENALSEYAEAGNIPGLQGQPYGREHQFEYLQTNWSPAARLLAGCIGAALGAYGAARRGVGGTATAVTGLSLLARSASNKPIRRLVGVGAGPKAVDYVKTMNFDAPIERVYAVWSEFERYPEFMTNVREISRLGEGRWRWRVSGPLGATVEWNAMTTSLLPNELIAWETEPGSPVQNRGTIRFQTNGGGKTRAHISLSYNPVAGVAGNILATLFGANPKREIDGDLMRMKSFIETGKPPHDAARRAEAIH